jgi:Leucine-rich repeat (LRR) protein
LDAPEPTPQQQGDDWEPVRKLHFPANNLRGTIPPEISLLTSVSSIDLSRNQLNGDLPLQIFADMSALTSLSLQYNFLTGSLPTQIGLWGNKLDGNVGLNLDLAHNFLGSTLPKELGQLSNLVTLNLADNRFTGPVSFPNLGALTNLRRFFVASESADW